VEQRLDTDRQVVSATFVTPYPPGFPVLVPGQVFSKQILQFIRTLDTPEVHGYRPQLGYRVFTDKALEIAEIASRKLAEGWRMARQIIEDLPAERDQSPAATQPVDKLGATPVSEGSVPASEGSVPASEV